MARQRGSFPARRQGHNPTEWNEGPGTDGLTGGKLQISAAGSVVGVGTAPTVGGFTIVRLRGEAQLVLDMTQGADEGALLAIGIGIVTAEAFAVGLTAMPDPSIGADADWDGWMYHRFVQMGISATIVQGEVDQQSIARFEVDSKAMRKIQVGEVLALVLGMADEEGSVQATLRFTSRILIKNFV